MRHFFRRLIQVVVLSAFIATPLFSAPGDPAGRWQDPNEENRPKKGGEVSLIAISLRSIDAITKAAKDCEYELPPFLSAVGVEMMFSFLGKGNVDSTRPIGAVYAVQKGLENENRMLFVIPVKNLIVPFKFVRERAAPAGKTPNTYMMGTVACRFTNRYVIMGATLDGVSAVKLEMLEGPYNDKNKLAGIRVDLAAIRKIYPGGLFTSMEEDAGVGAPRIDRQNAQISSGFDGLMAGFDNVNLSLYSAKNKGYKLRLGGAPVTTVATKPIPIPRLPKGCGGAFSYALAGLKKPDGLIKAFAALADSDDLDDGHLTEAERKQRGQVTFAIGQFFGGGRAVSWGLRREGDDDIVYIAKNIPAELHEKRLKTMIELCGKSARLFDETKLLDIEHYESKSGKKVMRIHMMDDGAYDMVVDIVRDGDLVRMTMTDNPGRHIEKMLALPDPTTVTGGTSGWLDGKTVLAMMNASTSTRFFAASEELKKAVAEKFDENGLTCKGTIVRGQMHVDLALSQKSAVGLFHAVQKLKDIKPLKGKVKVKENLVIIDRRLKTYPSWSPFLLRKAGHLLRSGQPEAAAKSADVFLKKHPQGYDGYELRAVANYTAGDYKQALADIRKRQELQPATPVFALITELAIAEKMGDAGDVLKRVSKALKTTKRKSWPWPLLRYLNGKLSIDEIIRRAAEEDGTDEDKEHTSEAHYSIGIKALLAGKTELAALHFRKCLKLDENAYERVLAEYELSLLERKE